MCIRDSPRPDPDADDLVAFGADLAPQTLIAAYAAGYFPMPMSGPLERVRLRRANGCLLYTSRCV